jgi:PKD domain
MVEKRYILFLMTILFLGFASASFEVGNLSNSFTKTSYGPGQTVEGWVNISFSNEFSNSDLEDSRGNSIELFELLNTTNYDYSCSPSDCTSDYSAINSELTKSFELVLGNSLLLGFEFNEDIQSINFVSFNLQSSAVASCNNQLKVDVFNDGIIDVGNSVAGSSFCYTANDYGCFDNTQSLREFQVEDQMFCQNITLGEYPGFKLGAWVKDGGGTKNLIMELFDSSGDSVGSCELPSVSPVGTEVACEIDYLVLEDEEHWVCLYSNSGEGVRYIQGYSGIDECGFHGSSIPSIPTSAYQLFAKGKQFDNFGTLPVTDTLSSGESFGQLIQEYISEKYGTLDCSVSGCIVPVKLISGQTQVVNLNNLQISVTESGGTTTMPYFSDLTEIPSKINSDFGLLSLNEAGFLVGEEIGDFDFTLYLNDEEVFTDNVSIEDVPKILSLEPLKAAAGFPTNFTVFAEVAGNLTSYSWDFGDNGTQNTLIPTVSYNYLVKGNYTLDLIVTDSFGRSSSKSFSVEVGSPNLIIDSLLNEKRQGLDNVLLQLESFDVQTKGILTELFDFDALDLQLKDLENRFGVANVSDIELGSILTDALAVDIPLDVSKSMSADAITFYPQSYNINLEVLKSITNEDYGEDESGYTNGVLFWNQENLDAFVAFDEYEISYSSGVDALRIFEVSLSPKTSFSYDSYFIVEDIEGLNFLEDYSEQQISDYWYITVSGSKTIRFSTIEDVEFSELPMFISPEISELSVIGEEIIPEEEGNNKKWVIFGLVLILLIVVGIVLYVVLQTWYKHKYERYLFKDRNNLFNIITYIDKSKRKGMGDKDIVKNLKKAKWNSEQIRYALRKYSGKRTGMAEISLGGAKR